MRIRILSDLHREFGHATLPHVEADAVVLAGDIDKGARGVAWARQAFPGIPVLYVAGNHEYYGDRIGRLLEKLREAAAGSNVRILENDTATLDGVRFFGATLWTDFCLCNDRLSAFAAAADRLTGMNDYRKIRRRDTTRLEPHDTAQLHAESRLALTRFLVGSDLSRSVVITHHAPSLQSLPPARRTHSISAAYASDLDALIQAHAPALWIHGHIHTPCDYRIGGTRILCNAHGYITKEARPGFRPDLVVEI